MLVILHHKLDIHAGYIRMIRDITVFTDRCRVTSQEIAVCKLSVASLRSAAITSSALLWEEEWHAWTVGVYCCPLFVSICLTSMTKQYSEDGHEHHYPRLGLMLSF
jgi:hypothetical protein